MLTRRRRLLRAAARPRAQGAPRAGRPVRVDPRRRLHDAARARRIGVRAVVERGAPAPRRVWIADKENEADLVGGVNQRASDGRATCCARSLDMQHDRADQGQPAASGDEVLQRIGRRPPAQRRRSSRPASRCSRRPTSHRSWSRPPSSPIRKRKPCCAPPKYQDKLVDALVTGMRALLHQESAAACGSVCSLSARAQVAGRLTLVRAWHAKLRTARATPARRSSPR